MIFFVWDVFIGFYIKLKFKLDEYNDKVFYLIVRVIKDFIGDF